MNRIFLTSILILLFLFNLKLNAQLQLPRLSQKATVTQVIGLSEISISYSRPNVKDRVIWGELVPYGKVWRTGADEATTISFGDSVLINGNKIEAGKYSLFSIPNKNKWTIIFNKAAKQWGSFNYDSTKDVLRINVTPEKNEFNESMLFTITDVKANSAIINLSWENLKVSFEVEMNVDARAYKNIKSSLSDLKEDDWVTYAVAANYAADNDIHLDEALQWINKSINIKSSYYNNYVKAKIYYKKGDYEKALEFIELSRKEGSSDSDFKNFSETVDKLENEIKKN